MIWPCVFSVSKRDGEGNRGMGTCVQLQKRRINMLEAALKLATINKLAYGKGCKCKNKVVKAYDGDLCEPVTFRKR